MQRFERSAAFLHGIHIEGINNESFLQHVTDNADHNLRTIDGLNTFHGMEIIAIVTPRVTIIWPVPKVTLPSSQVIEIELKHIFCHAGKKNILRYDSLPNFSATNAEREINLFWKCTWLLKPERPLWNGFMQMICKGDYPRLTGLCP